MFCCLPVITPVPTKVPTSYAIPKNTRKTVSPPLERTNTIFVPPSEILYATLRSRKHLTN